MRSLVTGANGFVGSAVLRVLIDEGHEVRSLVRANSNKDNLRDLNVEIVEGDLRDVESLRMSVADCDNLFHVAADYRLWVPDPKSIYQTNVDGTRDLIRSAVEAGVKRIVYTSSVATLGLNSDGSPANEDTPVSLEQMIGHYKRSKFLAEKAVDELVESIGAPVVIVNPSTPVGPRDIKPTPTGRIFVDALNNRMPAYVDTGLNIVHVDDVAIGHLLAFQHGEIGERYILGGENMSLKSILTEISRLSGAIQPRICIPHNVVLPIAWLAERWAQVSGKPPIASVDEVKMSKKYMYFSSDKATRKLSYAPRPALEAIKDACVWFSANGYCRNF
jgi:dihydroflavonol-4-reductase